MIAVSERKKTLSEVVRFLIVGGSNTLLTYAIFVGLGLVIAPWIAYSVAFAVGLVWVAFGSSRVVFRSQATLKQLSLFCAWYLFIFGLGQLVIRLINPQDFWELATTSLIVLLCTTPLTFLGGKFLFRQATSPSSTNEEKGS